MPGQFNSAPDTISSYSMEIIAFFIVIRLSDFVLHYNYMKEPKKFNIFLSKDIDVLGIKPEYFKPAYFSSANSRSNY